MRLAVEQFKNVVRDTVLVALDLLLINERGEVLVGRRLNAPARNYLFVPGGRIMKGESVAAALQRVVMEEVGLNLSSDEFVLQGIYDHCYEDNCFGDPDISTQYVVIACRCRIRPGASVVADQQHESLRFVPIADLLADSQTHPYTKSYFVENASNLFLGEGGGVFSPQERSSLGDQRA
jgi:colanic acid biosynthesis protein WcaH